MGRTFHRHRIASALSIAACVAVLAAPAAAQAEPASEASVQELLVVTKAEALMLQSQAQIEGLIRQGLTRSVAGKTLNDEQKRIVDSAPARLASVVRESLNWSSLEPIYVAIYRENFDQNEVDGLIAFYKSPVGRSFVEKMPAVMQRSMSVTMLQMQSLMPKMQAEMEQILREAKISPKT